jgi:glycolate oxidase
VVSGAGRRVLRELKKMLGPENVVTDEFVVGLYARNAAGMSSGALAVVFPRSVEDVSGIVRLAYRESMPIYPQGSATELTGSSIPAEEGLVISFQNMDRIKETSIVDGYVVAEPGVVLRELDTHLSRYGYMFPVDPASIRAATVGGAVNTGAGGMRGAKYGTMREWIMGLQVVLPDEHGTVMRIGCRTAKCRQGYDLVRLIVGSEGTLALVTEATLRITPVPENTVTLLGFYEELDDLAQTVVDVKKNRLSPYIMEFIDAETVDITIKAGGSRIEGRGHALIISLDVPPEASRRYMDKLRSIMESNNASQIHAAENTRKAEELGLFDIRRGFHPATVKLAAQASRESKGRILVYVEDIAVPPSRLAEAIRRIRGVSRELGVPLSLAGHAGDGNIHPVTWFDTGDPESRERIERWVREVMRIAVELGGTVSSEHGIGISKKEGLRMELEAIGGLRALSLMAEIKKIFDPKGILNPGKIV